MKMKKWIWLTLFGCGAAQADMLSALKAYEQQHFAEAQHDFAELLPLGNELAAFNLGIMAYQAKGQPKNLVNALAYFMLAAELNHPQAAAILTTVQAEADTQQLEQAQQRFAQLNSSIVINSAAADIKANAPGVLPVKRVAPDYPLDAAKRGQFGYVALRFLVDEAGNVTVVDTLDAYPEKVFEKSAIKAVKRWKYAATGQQHLLNVRLDYSLEGAVSIRAVEDVVGEHKLWQYAVAGVPEYQFVLGTLLSLLEVQSQNGFWYDPELALAAEPDFSIFTNRAQLKADIDGFFGHAVVKVNKQGVITEQVRAEFEAKNTVPSLIGAQLHGIVEADVYRLTRTSDWRDKKIYVTPSITVSRSMSGQFWWEQAAKNGHRDAQRVMAAYDKQWESYLLNQQDAEVMAWAGTKLMLEGDHAQGMQFLDGAIAKNYQLAEMMKKQFVWYNGPKEATKRP
jgi:TonB family protein